MKKTFIAFFLLSSAYSFSQGTWTQKADFGGMARKNALGFSIGTKGYIGLGYQFGSFYDFWEWDQASDVWTQKASSSFFPDASARGFSIGTKGYIVTGWASTKIFLEWDQGTNSWVQKANFAGEGRINAVAFTIGTKGYIGTGNRGSIPSDTLFNDFWEWDQSSDIWTQKADFGGTARCRAVGFSIGNKGYIGTGQDADSARSDFWEWDQATNVWIQKANFGGGGRNDAVAFSIGLKGYIGTGWTNDFWEWNQTSNTWAQKTNLPVGGTRENAVGFSIGNRGYIGTGGSYRKDFWEYCDTCTVDINEINNNTVRVSIFPNPTAVKIVINSNRNINSVEIYNIQGEKVCSTSQPTNEIDLSNQPMGVYFVQIKMAEGVVAKKIVVQR